MPEALLRKDPEIEADNRDLGERGLDNVCELGDVEELWRQSVHQYSRLRTAGIVGRRLTTRTIVICVGLSVQMSWPSPKMTTAASIISQHILRAYCRTQTHLSQPQSSLRMPQRKKPQ